MGKKCRIRTLKDGTQIANAIGVFFEKTYSMVGFPRVERIGKKKAKLFDNVGKFITEGEYHYIKAIECEMIKEIEANRNANRNETGNTKTEAQS